MSHLKSLAYTNYLKIDELFTLQQVKSSPEEHDETLVIIIHQTYELWFKQILHEFEMVRIMLPTISNYVITQRNLRVKVVCHRIIIVYPN